MDDRGETTEGSNDELNSTIKNIRVDLKNIKLAGNECFWSWMNRFMLLSFVARRGLEWNASLIKKYGLSGRIVYSEIQEPVAEGDFLKLVGGSFEWHHLTKHKGYESTIWMWYCKIDRLPEERKIKRKEYKIGNNAWKLP